MSDSDPVAFVDLHAQQQAIRAELDAAVKRVLDHGRYVLGDEVAELEGALVAFANAGHCVTCGNGTDALQIALMALGVGPGDEVVVPAFSYAATAEAVALLGATPVFADVEPDTYNLDPAALQRALTARTRAVIPVSLFGQCPEFDEILEIAAAHGIRVIEDAAQSFGASYKGDRSCALADISCTSFFPSKPLGCYGDGGAMFTHDAALAEKLRQIARHGQSRRYHHERLGVNSRLDTIQAAILLVKLTLLPGEIELRQQVAGCYNSLLKARGMAAPVIRQHNLSVFAQYTIEVDQRDEVQRRLSQEGIPTAVHYPIPLNRQPAFRADSAETPAPEAAETPSPEAGGTPSPEAGGTPVSEAAAQRVLSLPMHPYLTADTCERIVKALADAVSA